MTKKILKHLLRLLLIILAIFCIFHFLLTGVPFPLFRIDRLRNPQPVTGVQSNALILANNRPVTLPHITRIPTNEVFQTALKRGVEFDATTGRAYGLLRIFHWCGNDPMRYDRRKIDLSALAAMVDPTTLSEASQNHVRAKFGETINKYPRFASRYGPHGWRVENLYRLRLLTDALFDDTPPE